MANNNTTLSKIDTKKIKNKNGLQFDFSWRGPTSGPQENWGFNPPKWGIPQRGGLIVPAGKPLTHSQQRIKKFTKYTRGMSWGEYLPQNLHLGRFPDNLSVALTQPEGQLSLTSKNKNFNYLFS